MGPIPLESLALKEMRNCYVAADVPLKGIQDWIEGAGGGRNGYFGLFWIPLAPFGPPGPFDTRGVIRP